MKNVSQGRRNPKGATGQPLGVRLTPLEQEEIEGFAATEDRSRAWFLRFLILRGLAEYKREYELASKTTN